MRRIAGVLLAVLMMIGIPAVVAAQEATPAATQDHPLVGAWLVETDLEELPALDIFSSDGTHIEVDTEGLVHVGVWEATGDSTANLTFWGLGPEGATSVIRASIEVAPDGQAFTASFTFELIMPDGTGTGEIGPGTAEGTKLAVEPQGTPIGTFEEVFGEAPATPEG